MNTDHHLRSLYLPTGIDCPEQPDAPETAEAPEQSDCAADRDDPAPSGFLTTTKDGISLHCLSVIGQVEGHYLLPSGQKSTKYEHIIPLLVSVEESDRVDGLLVILNTVGGDVEAGLAIAEMIASMSKPTVSLVIGGGHSIGVPLAVCADLSFIVPSATMTVHPVRMSGTVIGAPQTYDYLTKMQNRILKFVSEHSHISAEDLKRLMMRPDEIATDLGTILEGEDAVKSGLIDRLGGLSDALQALRDMVKERKTQEMRGDPPHAPAAPL